jgi:hypothetical protein
MKEVEKIVKKIETKDFIVGLRNDGLYHVFFKDNVIIDLEVQVDLLKSYEEITGGKKGYFIIEAGHKCNVTKEARDNSVKMEDIFPVKAKFVFVQNAVYRMIANFYLKINKPRLPFHINDNFQNGINWLTICKSNNQLVTTK